MIKSCTPQSDQLKFAKKSLAKLETKTLPKVAFHVQRYQELSAQEKENFQNDFQQFVVKICRDIKGMIPELAADLQPGLTAQLRTLVARFVATVDVA